MQWVCVRSPAHGVHSHGPLIPVVLERRKNSGREYRETSLQYCKIAQPPLSTVNILTSCISAQAIVRLRRAWTLKGSSSEVAREHNLRDVNVELPRNKLIVFTGVSGSGKSSLAFDTIYAEGQRRYVESLSSYLRGNSLVSFPSPMSIISAACSPVVSIQQKTAGRNPRSTVGTITEVSDFLRALVCAAWPGALSKLRPD